MSFLDGFAGGAAGAGADILQNQRQTEVATTAAKSLADYNNDLAIKREQMVLEMKNAPLNRISAGAKAKLTEDVPVEAAPVTEVSGTDEAGNKFGFQGDIATQRKAIMSIADPVQREEALAQLDGQVKSDTKKGLINVAGKTRKRTADEALDAAVNDAKVNDLPAYADYEARVGKPLRDERRIDVTEKKTDAQAAQATKNAERQAQADARKYDVELKRLDLQQGTLEASNRKIDAWIENEAAKRDNDEAKAAGGKGQSPDKLGAIVNAMNASLKTLNEGSHGVTPAEKADYQRQVDTFARVRDRAAQLLDSGLTDRGAPEAPAKPGAAGAAKPAPAGLPQGAKQIGTSGGKPVYETPDGKRFVQK